MSDVRAAVTVLLAVAVATAGYRAYERSLLSPFELGAVRAGIPFEKADEDAKREMGHGYSCRSIGDEVRICQLTTDGPPGVLAQVVDRSGRVAVIQFRVTDESQRTREWGSRQIRMWGRVHAGDFPPSDPESDLNLERWQTADGHWAAEMAWRRSADAPELMTLTDERRLRKMAESSPAVLAKLVEERLLDSHDLANAAPPAAVTADAPQS